MITCTHCGASCQEGTRFCHVCGSALPAAPYSNNPCAGNSQQQNIVYVPVQPMQPVQQVPQSTGAGTASLVLGILGLFISWFTLGIFSLLAILFGIIGIAEAHSDPRYSSGTAVGGLVLGLITFLIELVILLSAGLFFFI